MKEYHKHIIRNSVSSTKKWLYHYLLDKFEDSDPNYLIVKQAVKDIYEFQDAILEQINKDGIDNE